jgi:hypothetical protein
MIYATNSAWLTLQTRCSKADFTMQHRVLSQEIDPFILTAVISTIPNLLANSLSVALSRKPLVAQLLKYVRISQYFVEP